MSEQIIEKPEKLEGYEKEPLGMGGYPIDSMLIRYEPRTIHEVCRRIDKDQYILDPDFQRDFIWPAEKQSKLIESILMRIPLPVFYLAERNDGKIIVVDGLQRLTTIHRFINNKFSLRHLDASNENILGKKFSDLHPKLKTRIEDTNLILYLIDEKVPDRAKLDIFERVNGGIALTRQQMRNCLYCGPATLLLKELAQHKDFLKATGLSLNKKSMRDREFVNRFLSFHVLGVRNYRGYMDNYLADSLVKVNNMDRKDISSLKELFLKSMRNNTRVFGKHAFRKHHSNSQGRNIINAALFDVFSIVMSKLDEEYVNKNKNTIHEAFYSLLSDVTFTNSITYSTNDVKRVLGRFNAAEEAFGEFYDIV